VLALVAGIVLTTVRRFLMAGFGSLALLAPSRLTATARAVAVAPITAAADGKRALTAPAVARMKNGSLVRWHRSLQGRRSGQPPLIRARLSTCWLRLDSSSDGSWNNGKTPAPTGVFFFLPTGSPQNTPPAHPPRYARDDAADPDLMVKIPTDWDERPHAVPIPGRVP
jgi:hypothetical protein